MRAIKFRAWDGEHIIYFNLDLCNQESRPWYWHTINNGKVMQYTGLKDKDGKEIFEGDIVMCFDENEPYPHIAKIEYQSDSDYPAFDLEPNVDCDSNGISYYIASGSIEVIGNIHQSPELLESK